MSQEVDERVVEMRFDNAQFEKNVHQTMQSLEKLNDSLRLDGAEKGFEKISDASAKVDFDEMQGALDNLSGKFSAVEVMGVAALSHITRQAIDTGEKLVKSLSLDQVTSGWNKYAQKTASVQTIMNATGKSIAKVNGYLEKLMWFSDETSYGFTDMTSALSTLTSTGGSIEKMIPMIMGMANATAYAGKGAAEFQRVIYNLAQSYGTGAIQLIDWKSVEQADVASQQLKQLLIDTGVELGKIKKGAVTTGSFDNSLQKKWADREVMEKAFGKYAEFAEAVKAELDANPNKYHGQASQAIDALADQYDEVTVKAFKAAQEAKSFSEAVDATKDAVSSGWMETFDILFGNYEEAKGFWSDLAEEFWNMFAGGAAGRNNWLKNAFDSGLDQLLGTEGFGEAGDNYTNLLQKALVNQVGGLRPEFDGSQDYDFILRCCEQAKQVIHIPKVLYHWRCHMNSVAANPESKAYAYEAGCRAIQEHYRRVGIEAEVEMTKHPGWYRSHVKIQGEPLVSIIIPNKDHIDDLEKCLSSVYEKSTWKNYEILIVENNSEEQETFEYYKNLSWRYPKARVLTWKEGFNYAAINNFAVKEAKGSYLLFLNNDVEVISPGWIEEMLMICQQQDVAIVGAKLYYPDNLIQHAGVVLGMGGIAGHIMCMASCEDKGYFGRAVNVQEISAVTAACMLMKAEDFQAVGGFDEEFVVAFNDIDLCMKARAAGKKVVFTPYAELYHYESKSRGMEDTPEKQFRFEKETKRFEEKWGDEMAKGDPYYNPNLSLKEADCSLRED